MPVLLITGIFVQIAATVVVVVIVFAVVVEVFVGAIALAHRTALLSGVGFRIIPE